MRFELEPIEAKEAYVCRGFRDDGPSYFVICTVKRNPDGRYEPYAWLSKKGEVPRYHAEAIRYLWAKGFEVAFTFEKSKFHLYERMLRCIGNLKIIRAFAKEYNGQDIEFYYGRIVPNDNQRP